MYVLCRCNEREEEEEEEEVRLDEQKDCKNEQTIPINSWTI